LKYPHPCTRCGFCCLSETCPVGRAFYGIGKADPCPALSFDDLLSCCALVEALGAEALGIGRGCCIKARAYRGGVCYDFSALPPQDKFVAVYQLRIRR